MPGPGGSSHDFPHREEITAGERVADALSKGKLAEVEAEMPGAVDVSHRCSQVLSRWIHDPGWTGLWVGDAYRRWQSGLMWLWAGTMCWTWRS